MDLIISSNRSYCAKIDSRVYPKLALVLQNSAKLIHVWVSLTHGWRNVKRNL